MFLAAKWCKCLVLAVLMAIALWGSSPSWAAPEKASLTLQVLQERLNSPVIREGITTLNLSQLSIDLSGNNAEFRDQFYQQIQTYLNRSKQPVGLDFSQSQIQGDINASRLGLPTPLSKGALPVLLTAAEQQQIEQDIQFFSQAGEQIKTIAVFRGPLKLQGTNFWGNVDFSKSFFLQRLEITDTNFEQNSNWSESRFGRSTDFTRSVFNKEANFYGSHFFGPARFREIQFRGLAKFVRSRFEDEATFSQADFSQLADWNRCQWLKSVNFSQSRWRDRTLFSDNKFNDYTSFKNATFEKVVAFRTSQFKGILDFQDVKLLDQVDFSDAVFTENGSLNIPGLAFDSDRAKILGDRGIIGGAISLPSLEGNDTVLRNLIKNFRRQEQIPDANKVEYKMQELRLRQIGDRLKDVSPERIFLLGWFGDLLRWMFLNLLLLLSGYGTQFNLLLGNGLIAIAYFGFLFWLIDRWRKVIPKPVLPTKADMVYMGSSLFVLTNLGLFNILKTAQYPLISLGCLSLILLPFPLFLVIRLYQKGRYHNLMNVSYFVWEGTLRQLRLLIVRLPVIPDYPLFRERYTYIPWEKTWNWLNYYDFSLNNFLKIGFNDIRMRDTELPPLVSALVWYQWGLGILYIALLFWTLSRTIPGLNLLIYLK